MTKHITRIPTVAVAVTALLILAILAAPAAACFALVVGKDASADGSVLMGHNEDDGGPHIVNHHRVPRRKFEPHTQMELLCQQYLNNPKQTWAYIWSEMPGLNYSDSFLNEWGVCIASDGCRSRENHAELSDTPLSYHLRRFVAQHARTARQGVQLAGKLAERFGYTDRGRTYIICDPNEGWFFCVVQGKHWLAQRVPDDQVAVVANTFAVRQVDLSDRKNVLASADIVDYAVARGWCDPAKDGPFDFARCYSSHGAPHHPSNIARQWAGLRLIAAQPVKRGPYMPFSVKPRRKLAVPDVIRILRNHYLGQEPHDPAQPDKPYPHNGNTICNVITQTSFVAQLRPDMPRDVGLVYWMCLAKPCTSVYIPFHFGSTDFPPGYAYTGKPRHQEIYSRKVGVPFTANPHEAFWTFSNFHHHASRTNLAATITPAIEALEKQASTLQAPVERAALRLYPTDPTAARLVLTNYSRGIYQQAVEAMHRALPPQD